MRNSKNKIIEDFNNVSNFIKGISYSNLIDDEIELQLKLIHKIAYAICRWKIFLNEKYDDYSIDEIFSDFIEVLYITPLKDTKILMFLIRNIIDNFRRYIKNTQGIMGTDFDDFIVNLKNISAIKEYKDSVDIVSRMYKESSNVIHSTYKNRCNLIDGLNRWTTKDNVEMKKCVDDIYNLGKSIIFIFVLIYRDVYVDKFGRTNREIILNVLDKKRSNKVRELLH